MSDFRYPITGDRRAFYDKALAPLGYALASYYAAFVRDPDGHNVEAVCHRPA
jgi:hypothetical protein